MLELAMENPSTVLVFMYERDTFAPVTAADSNSELLHTILNTLELYIVQLSSHDAFAIAHSIELLNIPLWARALTFSSEEVILLSMMVELAVIELLIIAPLALIFVNDELNR